MDERLIESLDKIQEYIEATEDFVIEQAPLVAQEILLRGQVMSAMVLVIAVVGAVALMAIAPICYRKYNNTHEDIYGMASYMSVIASFVFAIFTIPAAFDCITPWFMPRLYLLEQISELL